MRTVRWAYRLELIFGCNYKSRQIGRVLRYNKKYCKDKRLASIRNWITTGDVYSREFGYYELPWKLDIFDRQTYAGKSHEIYSGVYGPGYRKTGVS